jgi:hypothetical protein
MIWNNMHEYGHTIDSRAFGLSYLFAIGIPSVISAGGSEYNSTAGMYTHDYYWTETRANRRAAKYFGTLFWNYPRFRSSVASTLRRTKKRQNTIIQNMSKGYKISEQDELHDVTGQTVRTNKLNDQFDRKSLCETGIRQGYVGLFTSLSRMKFQHSDGFPEGREIADISRKINRTGVSAGIDFNF